MSNKININKTFHNTELELSLAIIERNTAQYRKEQLDKLILELQSRTSLLTEKQPEAKQPEIGEIAFNLLNYDSQEGVKLGDFEVAHKSKNTFEKWQLAYNILNVNSATIQNRYHLERFQYSYWIFNQIIFRQKLKEKQ